MNETKVYTLNPIETLRIGPTEQLLPGKSMLGAGMPSQFAAHGQEDVSVRAEA